VPLLNDVIAWIALAAASGIIGNVAHDQILDVISRTLAKVRSARRSQASPKTGAPTADVGCPQELLQGWDRLSETELHRAVGVFLEYYTRRLGVR
jgi:hypothetical protein